MANPKLSQEQRNWLSSTATFPDSFVLTKRSGTQIVFRVLDRDQHGQVAGVKQRMGAKGFVLRVQDDDDGAVYAAKLCVPEDYEVRTEKDETKLASKLRPAGNLFATPIHAGRVLRFADMPGPQEELVCFVSEWIDGFTLEDWCTTEGHRLSGEFIVDVAHTIVRVIKFLEDQELKHDDLHWGNVMIRRLHPGLILTEADEKQVSLTIIDMGSLKPLTQANKKSKDDYLSMVHILHQLYNIAWQDRGLATSVPAFFKYFRVLLTNLLDEDPARHYPSSELLVAALNELRATLVPDSVQHERRFDPFEGISAEHLADDETLLSLFNRSLPWFSNMMETKPIVLVGPRGCGKSMLFRYLSAPTQAKARASGKADDINGFGVYVSCATHLQNSLVWIAREKGRAIRYAHQISTFFQLVVARELMRSIGIVWQDKEARKLYDLRENILDKWIAWVDHQFNNPIETPHLPGEPRVLHYATDLDRLRVQVHKQMLRGEEVSEVISDSFLGEITEKLCQLNPAFRTHPIIFLLDDYTENRLGAEVQSVLTRIVFERRASHYFKVSCERMGLTAIDSDGVRIDASREFEVMDAGQHASEDCSVGEKECFLQGLIDQRLERANWSGRCATLIGSSGEFHKDLALAARIRQHKQGRQVFYFGMTHIARLWSGDIATILQAVKDMCLRDHVNANSVSLISKATQHESIVAISKAYRARVKDLHPHGSHMSKILDSFGNMARKILIQGYLGKDSNPRRLYRIEMTMQSQESLFEELESKSPDAAELAKELLRRAIFHPLRESRGKEGPATTTIRWELRNIYRPSFGLSLESGESYLDIKTIEDFVKMLLEPILYFDLRAASYAAGKNHDRNTVDMFGDEYAG